MTGTTPNGVEFPTGSDLIKSSSDSSKLATDLQTMAYSMDSALNAAKFYRGVLPAGNLYSYYGPAWNGLWSVPDTATLNSIGGRPIGAGVGTVLIVGSDTKTSIVTWYNREFNGGIFVSTSSDTNRISPWKETTAFADYGNITSAPSTITHADQVDFNSVFSVWNAETAATYGLPSGQGKLYTEVFGNLRMQTYKIYNYTTGPSIWVRAGRFPDPGWDSAGFRQVFPATGGESSGGTGGSASGFKKVAYALNGTASSGVDTVTSDTIRTPYTTGFSSKRARVHIRNWNYATGTPFPGTVSFTGIVVGESTSGDDFTGTTKTVSSAFNLVDDEEYVSAWFDLDTKPGVRSLASVGYTTTGQDVQQGRGGCYRSGNASDVGLLTGFTGTLSFLSPFDFWIEFEVPETTPVVLGFGDSNTVGSGTTLPVNDSWLYQYARKIGAVPYLAAVHGANSGPSSVWASETAPAFGRFKDCAKPDSGVYFLGQNDIQPSQAPSLAELKSRLAQVVPRVKNQFTENLLVALITPSDGKTEDLNVIRRDFNTYLKTLPHGFKNWVDFVTPISSDDTTVKPEYNFDGLHFNTAGHTALEAELEKHLLVAPKVISGDTGLRLINGLWQGSVGTGWVSVSRSGSNVQVSIWNVGTNALNDLQATLPVGFRPPRQMIFNDAIYNDSNSATERVLVHDDGRLRIVGPAAGLTSVYGTVSWYTRDAWPSTLPGIAA